MKRPIALLVGGLLAASLTITPVGPASAATVTVPIPGGNATVTLTFPDIQWNDFKACQDGAPLVEVTGGSWVQEWDFGASIFPPGDTVNSVGYTGGWGEGTGTFSKDQTWLSLCPEKDAKSGVHTVRGTVSVSLDPSDIGVWFDEPFQTTFTVSPMVSTTSLAVPTVFGSQTSFSGRVLASSPTKGVIPADPAAQVAVEVLTGTAWTRLGYGNLDATGYYAIPIPQVLPPATQYRTSYLGTPTCAASTSPQMVVPTPALPSPKVKIKAVSARSKLSVNVNPNMGGKYWTFQVQRRNKDGSWKALKTYRTWGSTEKRTLNLRKGTYRVWVNPKFGYQGVMSANEVTLKR